MLSAVVSTDLLIFWVGSQLLNIDTLVLVQFNILLLCYQLFLLLIYPDYALINSPQVYTTVSRFIKPSFNSFFNFFHRYTFVIGLNQRVSQLFYELR